jgi:hypothetical protein
MATPPDFTAGAILTASQMSKIGSWKMIPTSATNGTVDAQGTVTSTGLTTSFSANGCFTGDFNSYRVICRVDNFSAADDFFFRVRSGTTDLAGAGYLWSAVKGNTAGTVNGEGNAADSRIKLGSQTGSASSHAVLDIMNIFNTKETSITGSNVGNFANITSWTIGGYVNNSNSYDGITFLSNGSANITAQIDVYGYN